MQAAGLVVASGRATISMSDSTFVDTNVLVYAVDDSEPEKRDIARRSLESKRYGKLVVSAQILGEFYVTVTRKLAEPIPEDKAAEALDWLTLLTVVPIDAALVKHGTQISRTAQLSYWDGLVVAAAARGGCQRLLSEDLNDGQRIGSVRVENPFRHDR
jgi:predicted nucleic acid-binding protein